jgi:hypothetical protein
MNHLMQFLVSVMVAATIGCGSREDSETRVDARTPPSATERSPMPEWEAEMRRTMDAAGILNDSDGDRTLSTMQSLAITFWGKVQRGTGTNGISDYVGHFGRDGASMDYAYTLAAPTIMLPVFRLPMRATNPTTRDVARLREEFHRALVAVCEAQVKLFLARPDLLDRYVCFFVWSRTLLGPPDSQWSALGVAIADINSGVAGASKEDYWVYARNMLLVMRLTGRDDLLRGATPESLSERFGQWRAWLATISPSYFAPNAKKLAWEAGSFPRLGQQHPAPLPEPATPFPDWSGPTPPRLGDWSQIYAISQAIGDIIAAEHE